MPHKNRRQDNHLHVNCVLASGAEYFACWHVGAQANAIPLKFPNDVLCVSLTGHSEARILL